MRLQSGTQNRPPGTQGDKQRRETLQSDGEESSFRPTLEQQNRFLLISLRTKRTARLLSLVHPGIDTHPSRPASANYRRYSQSPCRRE